MTIKNPENIENIEDVEEGLKERLKLAITQEEIDKLANLIYLSEIKIILNKRKYFK